MVHVRPLVLLVIVTSLMIKVIISSVCTSNVLVLKVSKLMVHVLLIEKLVMELLTNLSTFSLMLLIIKNAPRRLQSCVLLLMLPKSMSNRMEHAPKFALTTKKQMVPQRNANPMDAKINHPTNSGLTLMEHARTLMVIAKHTQ